MINVEYLEKVAYEKYAANVITSIIKNVGKPIGGALARIPLPLGFSTVGGYLGEGARLGEGLELAGNALGSALKNKKNILINTNTVKSMQKKTLPQRITNTIAKVGTGIKNFFGSGARDFNRYASDLGSKAVTVITHNLSPKNYKIIKSKGLTSDSLTGSELSFTGRKVTFSDVVRQSILDKHRGIARLESMARIEHPASLSRNAGINTLEMRKERQNKVKKFLLEQRQKRLDTNMAGPDPLDMIATYKSIKRHGKLNPIFDAKYNGNKVLKTSPGFTTLDERGNRVTTPGKYEIKDRRNTFIKKLDSTVDNFFDGSQGNRNFSKAIWSSNPRVFLKPQTPLIPQVHKSTTTPKMQQPHPQWERMKEPLIKPQKIDPPKQINSNKGELMSNTNGYAHYY